MQWKRHPVTQKVLLKLRENKDFLVEELVKKAQQTNNLDDIRYIAGQITSLDYLVSLEFLEDLKDESETDIL